MRHVWVLYTIRGIERRWSVRRASSSLDCVARDGGRRAVGRYMRSLRGEKARGIVSGNLRGVRRILARAIVSWSLRGWWWIAIETVVRSGSSRWRSIDGRE